jgi:acetyl esterase/lipase
MQRKLTILTIITALVSTFPFLHSKNRTLTTLLWLPKLLSGAFTFWLGLGSIIGILYGWMRRDSKLIFTGGLGTLLSLLFIRRVTRGHGGFENAFGPDWQKRIPPQQAAHLQRVRWPMFSVPIRAVPHQQDISFGRSPITGKALMADVWLPPKRIPASGLGVIYIHGGAWRLGAKDLGTRTFFQHLASLGHVVLDIDYTLFPECTMIDMVREVKLAVAWMKAHSSILEINPGRVILMGGSAGAHLALLAAYTPDNPHFRPAGISSDLSVRGVVAFYPPADFRNLPDDFHSLLDMQECSDWQRSIQESVVHLMNDSLRIAASIRGNQRQPRRTRAEASLFVDPSGFIKQLVGASPDENPQLYSLLSPAAHVCADCPPTLLLQGTDDFFQLLPGVQRLYNSLQDAGVPSILVKFPHCEHAFDLMLPQISPSAQAATYDVERFLALMAA